MGIRWGWRVLGEDCICIVGEFVGAGKWGIRRYSF